MDRVRPQQLQVAARVADALVYVVGIAGIVAGGLRFRDGDSAFALVAWVLTFVAGAALRLAAWATRALAQLLVSAERIERDLAVLLRDRAAEAPQEPSRGPYGRWGGWH